MNKSDVLSLQDCEVIIDNYLGPNRGPIVDYKIKSYSSEVNGFLGEHLAVQIKVKNTETTSYSSYRFFAKRFPFNQQLQSEFIKNVNAFGREILVFDVLLKEFEKTIPEFDASYLPKFCLGRDNDIVVFEDLDYRGYTIAQKPNLNLLDLDHLRLALKALAKFHAASIAYEEIKTAELGEPYRLIAGRTPEIIEPMYRKDEEFLGYKYLEASRKGLIALIDILPQNGLLPQQFKKKLNELALKIFEIMAPQNKFRNVLCHGDLWAKNVMFKYENEIPTECKLIDFQLLRYFPPAHDVLSFIFLTTNKEMRQHHYHNLLRFYHNSLKEELAKSEVNVENVLSYDDFKVSANYLLPQIKLQTANQVTVQYGNPEFLKILLKNDEEFKKFIFEDRGPFNLQLFQYDDNFKYIVTEALVEVREIVSFAKITREDCYKILNNKLGTNYYEFKSFEVIPCSEVTGFLGDYFKLKIHVRHQSKDWTYHLFVKCMPTGKAPIAMVTDTGAFHKEVFFYDNYAKMLKGVGVSLLSNCIANCYFTRYDELEVFDDLAILDYRSIPLHRNPIFEELSIAFRKLAKLHACSILLEEKMTEKSGKIYRLNQHHEYVNEGFFLKDEPHRGARHMQVGIDYIKDVIELHPDVIDDTMSMEEFLRRWDVLKVQFFDLVKPSKKFRNVLCHGDLWATNILFRHDGDTPLDCRFVDFQLTRYCPPAHDLLAILYLMTRRSVRVAHMQPLINVYYTELSHNLADYGYDINDIYPYDLFLESLDYMKPQMVVQQIVYRMYSSCTEDEIKELLGDEDVCFKVFYESRRDLVLPMLKKSEYYREIVREIIEVLYETCKEKTTWL